MSPKHEQATCRSCGAVFTLHRHDVSVHNRDRLLCPACGTELIVWDGLMFYTFTINHRPVENPDGDGARADPEPVGNGGAVEK